jgi:GT2 family glycosyltransferase
MNTRPRVSLVICLYVVTERFYTDLARFLDLDYANYELIFATERDFVLDTDKVPAGLKYRVVKATKKPISLSEKRDVGIDAAEGEYVAFIDDDAYPHPQWLNKAMDIFEADQAVGAVGGPNITALDDPFWAQVGGAIYESALASGKAQFRFIPSPRRDVMELQGVNMIVRTSILRQLGGFHSHLSSGDDSKLCQDIRNLGMRVVYDPEVAVYHHRRPFAKQHLRQIRTMGTHRGYFVKIYPETLTPIYFMPMLLVLALAAGLVLSLFFKWIAVLVGLSLLIVLLAGFLSSVRRSGFVIACWVAVGILLTHITYGIYFLKGMLFTKMEK